MEILKKCVWWISIIVRRWWWRCHFINYISI